MRRELACRSCGERLRTRGRRRRVDLRSSARRSAARRWPSAGGDERSGRGIGVRIAPEWEGNWGIEGARTGFD